jgi:hypothetical protein
MSIGELVDQDVDSDSESTGHSPPTTMALATTRQAQEVQAAMIVARRFPRNEERAIARITQSCKRQLLAESSQYEYTKGGTVITGPSIRLAEVLAQHWGNLDYGVVELDRKFGESTAMSYCWDLETNVRQTKVFTVRHARDVGGSRKPITSERDIYEHVANYGARRLRACILGIIPGDVQQLAMDECDKTIAGKNSEPRIDRVRKMIVAFAEIGISAEMIEAKLCHKTEAITDRQLISLRKIYTAIRDGVATPADHFKLPSSDAVQAGESIDDLKKQIAPKQELPDTSYDPDKKETKTDASKTTQSASTNSTSAAWSKFTAELAAATGVTEARDAYDRWFGPECTVEFSPEQNSEAVRLRDKRIEEIHASRKSGGKPKQSTLMDTNPTA